MRSVELVGGIGGSLARDATVRELARPLFAILERYPGATELVVNRPGRAHVEVGATWVTEEDESLSFAWGQSFARAVATYTDQNIGAGAPILSAMLPMGERIQIVLPPAVEPGTVSLTLRIPGSQIKALESYAEDGFFDHYVWAFNEAAYSARSAELSQADRDLVAQLQCGDLAGFLRGAVLARKNIAAVGDTGSGKTTLMKSLCQEIPEHERLVTIEDVRELFLPRHENRVHLLYSKGGQGVAELTPAQLIASNMRMKPDRVLLAELRGAEAFDFLKLLTTGHNGSITSYHAESCALAMDRYVFMAKEHPDAAIFDAAQLKRLVTLTLDVIVHVVAENVLVDGQWVKRRYLRQVQFDPVAKLDNGIGAAHLVGRGVKR
jgi:type IV secretion system protein VirB11